jgi:hypothetical protein
VQDNEKKRLRDFRESFEEERKGQQVGCISQGRLGTFPKVIFCVKLLSYLLCWRSYCTDPYSPYNKEEGMVFEAVCGHKFRG